MKREVRTLIQLTLPVYCAQMAQMALGVVDTVMTGGYAAADMAAVGIGWSVWLPMFLFGIGMIIAVVPAVGTLRGAGQAGTEAMRSVIRHGIWLALCVMVPLVLIAVAASYHLSALGVSDDLSMIAGRYIRAMMWGVLPGFLYVAVRSALEGFALVRPAMVASLIGLLVNIPVNYACIYGRFGMPELGGVGAGVALAVTNWVLFAVLLFQAWRQPDIRAALSSIGRPCREQLAKLVRVGFPSALAALNEGGLFSVVTLFIAPLGTYAVAGHNVAINVASVVFVLPMSIGMGGTIRVSNAIGAGNMQGVRLAARAALGLGLVMAAITSTLTVLFRFSIAGLYTSDQQVIAIAGGMLFIDAIAQLSDGYQSVSVGVLRGYNDTRALFLITFICYWVLTVPLAFVLCRTDLFGAAMGVNGVWWGIVIGLSMTAVCYFLRLRVLEHRLAQQLNKEN